jgi:hypothetical protein
MDEATQERSICQRSLMKPLVNLEETPGKTVGDVSRRSPAQTLDYLVRQFHAMGLKLPYPKGVYKFKMLDEANQWDWNHIMKAAKKKLQDHER